MAAPELPYIPPWNKLRLFLIGLLWTVLFAAASSVSNIAYDKYMVNEFTDWQRVKFTAAMSAIGGATGYWRKHIAWLTEPPTEKGRE